MTTDSRGGFNLSGRPPAPPSAPGESVALKAALQHGPMAFVGLKVGRDDRFRALAPPTLHKPDPDEHVTWRIDCIEIDDKPIELADTVIGPDTLTRNFGSGSCVSIRATNVDDRPGYFNATWELEEIR